jgi:hypothetical protein
MLLVELSPGRVDGDGDLTEKEIIRFERNSGVVSGRVREIQVSRTVQASSTLFFRSLCISAQKMVVFFFFCSWQCSEKLRAAAKLHEEDGAEDAEGRGSPDGAQAVQVSELK